MIEVFKLKNYYEVSVSTLLQADFNNMIINILYPDIFICESLATSHFNFVHACLFKKATMQHVKTKIVTMTRLQ